MAEIRVEIEIAAPVKKVFDFVADVETHTLYAGHFVESVTITSTIRRGKGVTFKQIHQGSGKQMNSEIVEFIPNKKVAWVATGKTGSDVLASYWFEETPIGTRVIHTINSDLFNDPQRRKGAYEGNEKELANLKKILEQS